VTESHQLRLALAGGDDYELCFTVAPEFCSQAEESLAEVGIPATRIGEIVSGDELKCIDSHGDAVAIDYTGYNHFDVEST